MLIVGGIKFKNKTKLTNFVKMVLRNSENMRPLEGVEFEVFKSLLESHPRKNKRKNGIVSIHIEKGSSKFIRIPTVTFEDGTIDDFSTKKCIENIKEEKGEDIFSRPSDYRRFVKLKSKGKEWAKCYYCECSLSGKVIYWNPNPRAVKKNCCEDCYKEIKQKALDYKKSMSE